MTGTKPEIVRPIEGSVTAEGIYCLFDGQRRVFLARYVMKRYRMSFEAYKAHCGLPDDYPSVAPGFSEERAKLAAGILSVSPGNSTKPRGPVARSDRYIAERRSSRDITRSPGYLAEKRALASRLGILPADLSEAPSKRSNPLRSPEYTAEKRNTARVLAIRKT